MWAIPIILLGLYLRISFFNVSVSSLPTITDEALNMLMAKNIGSLPILFWTQPYQFPLEAYILSLFIDFLPSNAFGARIVLAIICWISLLGFSWIFWRKKDGRFLGILLTAFPSTYLILRESGILIPQYTLTITFSWLILLLFNSNRLILGLISGLALSIHLLSIPIVAGVSASILFKRGRFLYFFGLLIGLIPYLVTRSAYKAVTGTVSFQEALNRFSSEIIPRILPVTAGPMPAFFPDWPNLVEKFSWLNVPFQYIFISLLGLCCFVRLFIFTRTKALELEDGVLIALVLSLITASFASFGVKYRYLLPVAIYFPFLVVISFNLFKNKVWRALIFTFGSLIALINFKTTLIVKEAWAKPGFSNGLPRNPKMEPLFEKLRSLGINHCYSSWWNIYQITWESNEEFICSQPFNERFPGWPLTPAHNLVKSSPKIAFVLFKHGEGSINPAHFRNLMREHNINYIEERVSQFYIFRDFSIGSLQKVADSFEPDLKEASFNFDVPIKLISFYSDPTKKEPPKISISIKSEGAWKPIFKRSEGIIFDLNLGIKESNSTTQTFTIPPSKEIKITVHGNRKIDEVIFYQ